MKKNKLLKNIFLASIGSMATSNISQELIAKNSHKMINSEDNLNLIEDSYSSKELTKKLLLKVSDDGTFTSQSHQSHRSHSSHRSHYSHYSSYSQKESSNVNAASASTSINSSTLGNRTLKLNDSGQDVFELILLLFERKMVGKDYEAIKIENAIFDENIEFAIKQFQKENNIEEDGIVNSTTLYYLMNK
jgi:murein L,D-transpeptidase YcbB/YkuD